MLGRLGAATLLAVGLTLSVASAAQAHVRVTADVTTSGADSDLTFEVPNESATAGTVKFSVQLPQTNPFLEVSVKPVPGWKIATKEEPLPKPVVMEGTTITKAVRTVTWTAQADQQIGQDEYQEFAISVAPMPPPGTVLLPAVQTYSDGTMVSWNQPTPASGEEPEHPVPALQVTAAEKEGAATPTPAGPVLPAAAAPTNTETKGTMTTTDNPARVLGGIALVVAIAGLAVAAVGLRRRSAGPSA